MKKFEVNFILQARVACLVEAKTADDAIGKIMNRIPDIRFDGAEETDALSWESEDFEAEEVIAHGTVAHEITTAHDGKTTQTKGDSNGT